MLEPLYSQIMAAVSRLGEVRNAMALINVPRCTFQEAKDLLDSMRDLDNDDFGEGYKAAIRACDEVAAARRLIEQVWALAGTVESATGAELMMITDQMNSDAHDIRRCIENAAEKLVDAFLQLELAVFASTEIVQQANTAREKAVAYAAMLLA